LQVTAAPVIKDGKAGEGITGVVVRLAYEADMSVPINVTLYTILKPWVVRIATQLRQST
jgi:hypothetical protein